MTDREVSMGTGGIWMSNPNASVAHFGSAPTTGRPQHLALPINPDCRDGKHKACRGDAWDLTTDQAAPCTCECHGSPDRPAGARA